MKSVRLVMYVEEEKLGFLNEDNSLYSSAI